MTSNESLYFIAILPPQEMAAKVIELKQYFASNFSSPKGLNVLPHITLQMPFRTALEKEMMFIKKLTTFATHQKELTISLNGFGFFPGRRSHVVYVCVEKNSALRNLHDEMMHFLRDEFNFSKQSTPFRYNPHITIAYRDLSREQFKNAWPEFEHAEFTEKWKCNSFHLLKHDGKRWQSLKEFKLNDVI